MGPVRHKKEVFHVPKSYICRQKEGKTDSSSIWPQALGEKHDRSMSPVTPRAWNQVSVLGTQTPEFGHTQEERSVEAVCKMASRGLRLSPIFDQIRAAESTQQPAL